MSTGRPSTANVARELGATPATSTSACSRTSSTRTSSATWRASSNPTSAWTGHLRVAIAFADLAGYTRMTEELGDEHAVDVVERFVGDVEHTLPDDARVVKTIGDAVMVVGADPGSLVDWAVGFQALHATRPLPRIGLHLGQVLYRDGDYYYGREVNQAARVSARAGGGEVLVTRPVAEAAGPPSSSSSSATCG